MITEYQKRQAWNAADTIAGISPETWRRDRLGNRLRKGSYGTRGKYAWVVVRSAAGPAADGSGVRRPEALHVATAGNAGHGAGRALATRALARYAPLHLLPQPAWPPPQTHAAPGG